MKHPKAVQALVLLDLKAAFRQVGVHYSPADLHRIARKRSGGPREVGVAIRRIRDSGTILIYSPSTNSWSHEVDADIFAARLAQKIEWQSLRTYQRECRAIRGEYERNPADLGLKRELIKIEQLCVMLGGACDLTAVESLAPTKVVA